MAGLRGHSVIRKFKCCSVDNLNFLPSLRSISHYCGRLTNTSYSENISNCNFSRRYYSLFSVKKSKKMSSSKSIRFLSASSVPRIPLITSSSRLSNPPLNEQLSTDPVELAKTIFCHGLQNVLPTELITSHVTLQGSLLSLKDEDKTTVDLSHYNKKYVVGFGKACLPMAETLLKIMNGQVDKCIVSIPEGSRESIDGDIEVHMGAQHNIPDEAAYKAAQRIVDLVRSCTPNDLLIILISGGGSALLPYPIPPITMDEKQDLIRSLSKSGCTINELNSVRKKISLVKGGGLVEMCRAKKIITLIISDVAGSPLSTIASGPTVPNMDDREDAWKVIEKYNLDDDLPQSILSIIQRPLPIRNYATFQKVTNLIIGDNQVALEAASEGASRLGLHPFIVTSQLVGEASEVGGDLASLAEALSYFLNYSDNGDDIMSKPHLEAVKKVFRTNKWSSIGIIPEVFQENENSSIGICLLFGGETVVKVKGNGIGGRNQELTLAAGVKMDSSRNLPWVKDKVAILSAGTDGFDGPNSAAGAVVGTRAIYDAQLDGLSPLNYLKANDSFTFFEKASGGKYHIITGHTETNVMDMTILVILKKDVLKILSKKKSKM